MRFDSYCPPCRVGYMFGTAEAREHANHGTTPPAPTQERCPECGKNPCTITHDLDALEKILADANAPPSGAGSHEVSRVPRESFGTSRKTDRPSDAGERIYCDACGAPVCHPASIAFAVEQKDGYRPAPSPRPDEGRCDYRCEREARHDGPHWFGLAARKKETR